MGQRRTAPRVTSTAVTAADRAGQHHLRHPAEYDLLAAAPAGPASRPVSAAVREIQSEERAARRGSSGRPPRRARESWRARRPRAPEQQSPCPKPATGRAAAPSSGARPSVSPTHAVTDVPRSRSRSRWQAADALGRAPAGGPGTRTSSRRPCPGSARRCPARPRCRGRSPQRQKATDQPIALSRPCHPPPSSRRLKGAWPASARSPPPAPPRVRTLSRLTGRKGTEPSRKAAARSPFRSASCATPPGG